MIKALLRLIISQIAGSEKVNATLVKKLRGKDWGFRSEGLGWKSERYAGERMKGKELRAKC